MNDEQPWKPVPLGNLPPGHFAYEKDPGDGGPVVIKIEGLAGFVTGSGDTAEQAEASARARLKLIGGLLA